MHMSCDGAPPVAAQPIPLHLPASDTHHASISPLMDDLTLRNDSTLLSEQPRSHSSTTDDTTSLAKQCTPLTVAAVVTDIRSGAQSDSPSLADRICDSRLFFLWCRERAVHKDLELPPPIHRFYRYMDRANGNDSQRRQTDLSHEPFSTDYDSVAAARVAAQPRGDVYSYLFSRRELVELRAQQRTYLRLQRSSVHAPQQVNLEEVGHALLHEHDGDDEMNLRAAPNGIITAAAVRASAAPPRTSLTDRERVVEALSVFCTRGIPQEEYVEAVLAFRIAVLQRRCQSVPTGVVVPSLVRPSVSTAEALRTRRCTPMAHSAKEEKAKKVKSPQHTTEKAMGDADRPAEAETELTVTYPHPGTPYTFADLTCDPRALSDAKRRERRAALLHRRTHSEDLYGTPAPYLSSG